MKPVRCSQWVNTLFNSRPTLVVNSFYNTSQLKSRIQMLYQSRNTSRVLWRYAMALPLLATLIGLTAAREQLAETLTTQPGDKISVSGRVVDVNGKPVPKATVLIAGGTRGTPTDENGRFTLSDVPTTAKLAISSVGYEVQLIAVRRSSILAHLKRTREELPTMGATAAYRAVGVNKAMPVSADPPDSQTVNGEVFTVVEQNPVFPDGIPGLMYYVAHALRYPVEAQQANVQGTVFVKFVVTATGSVNGVRVVKGLGKGCNQEAVRVVSQMPRWKPAKQYGKPVPVEYVLPVQFALEKTTDKRTGQRQPRSGALDRAVGNLSNTHQPDVSKTETGGVGSVLGKVDEHLLYVLDNKPLLDNFDITDRQDIEGFELIPGQNAAKAYGVAGKSGVMHLHTKATNRQNPEVVEALFGVVKQLDPTETDFRINGSTATNGEVLQLSTDQIRKVVINKDRNGPYGYVTIYTK